MTQALELRESAQPVALTSQQLNFISKTDFVPLGLRGNLPAILACVTTGRELGLGDMTALRSIHIIDGKATFSAELMSSLVRKRGHSITGTVNAEKAVVTGKRADNGDTMTSEWTIEQAKKITYRKKGGGTGILAEKDNWKNYPEAMLYARAVSQLCRMLFADCFAGASYTPEELGAGDVTADELMDETPPETGAVVSVDDSDIDADLDERQTAAGPPMDEQRARLLELVVQLSDAHGDTNWSEELTKRLRKEFKVGSYNDLSEPQVDELIGWLEAALPKDAA